MGWPKIEFHTKMISRQVYLQDFLEFLALFLSLGVLLLGVVAVLTQASRISSSPVSYISESVVAHPLDDTLCLLESDLKNNYKVAIYTNHYQQKTLIFAYRKVIYMEDLTFLLLYN